MTSTTAIVDTIPVATSTGSMGASHTGIGVYKYGFSMRGNNLGVSTHREPFSYTPWGFPEHGGFPVSYTGSRKSTSTSTCAEAMDTLSDHVTPSNHSNYTVNISLISVPEKEEFT